MNLKTICLALAVCSSYSLGSVAFAAVETTTPKGVTTEQSVVTKKGTKVTFIIFEPDNEQKPVIASVKENGTTKDAITNKIEELQKTAPPTEFILKPGETLFKHLGSHALSEEVANQLGFENSRLVRPGHIKLVKGKWQYVKWFYFFAVLKTSSRDGVFSFAFSIFLYNSF